MSQTQRLLAWLRANPGASSLEITIALKIVNVTGRVSDLRASGHVIDCREVDGVARYYLRDATPGVARIEASDSKAQIDRKMAEAFAPVTAMREAWDRVFGGDS